MTDALTLNPLAVTNADVLRALEIDPPEFATVAELARYLKRDKSNLNKTLKSLASAGLLGENALADGLTDAGRAQLAAIGRAEHGGEKRKPRGRWPLDKIARNPANRVPRAEDVAALADTVEAAGDVLQNVQLTPPDAHGVRMLLAGEHRWLAARLLEREGRLPEDLADGLPFSERRASVADQILIRIVENTARADLSPLEDARLLRDLQVQTGWSAREVAKKTGRSPGDSEAGVRDVQLKIKVAKEATPEAIAEYERTGSWDALRDSVSKPKEPKEPAAPDNPHLALFLAEAALLADDVEGVWDGTLMLEPGLQWPVSWEDGWFSWHAETGRFALEDKATRWLAAADLGGDPDLLLAQLRAGAGIAAQLDARPWATATLRDAEGRMKGGGPAPEQTRIEDDAAAPEDSPPNYGWSEDEAAQHKARIKAACDALKPKAMLVLLEIADYVGAAGEGPGSSGRREAPIGPRAYTDQTGQIQHLISECGLSFWYQGDRAAVCLFPFTVEQLAEYGFLTAEGRAEPDVLARLRIDALGEKSAAKLAEAGRYWTPFLNPDAPVDESDDPLVVNGHRYPNLARANEARARIEGQRISIAPPAKKAEASGGGLKAALEELGHACPAPSPAGGTEPADAWGRDDNEIVADRSLLAKAGDLAMGRSNGSAKWARELLSAAGFSGPFGVTESDDPMADACIVAFDGASGATPLLTIDVNGQLPDDRARALALICAWALNHGFDEERAEPTPAEEIAR